MSKVTDSLANLYLPPGVRTVVIKGLGTAFGVNFSEVVDPIESFPTWNHFFGRRIIPRPIDTTEGALLAPADSKVLSVMEIKSDEALVVKGINYSLGNFLSGKFGRVYDEADLAKLHRKKHTKLYSVIFYLAPRDYHRYHSMAECTVTQIVHVRGLLFPVKESYLEKVPGVYEINERVMLKGYWQGGTLVQSYVGATNVGSISINKDPSILTTGHPDKDSPLIHKKNIEFGLKAGEEVGRFLMGSSVVVIVEVPENFKWEIQAGQTVRYGQRIGK